MQFKKSKFYYTGNRDIGCKNLMSLLLFGLKNDLLQIMSCGDIVAATVLENTGIVMKCFKILVRNAQVKILLKTLSAETAVLKIEFDDDIVATKKLKGNRNNDLCNWGHSRRGGSVQYGKFPGTKRNDSE